MKPFTMRVTLTTLLTTCLAAGAAAAQETDAEGESQPAPVTLAELARGADYIGLLQVKDTRYETVRDLPSEGHAIMGVLVNYRHAAEPRMWPEEVEVYEEGFDESSCYYPERQNEGQRFLAFLKKRVGKDGYEGTRPGCMIPVYVTADNQYAVRYPVPGLNIPDAAEARRITFADPDAYVRAGEEFSYTRTEEWTQQGWLKSADDDRFVFTHGVPLEDIRPIIEANDPRDSEDESDAAATGS